MPHYVLDEVNIDSSNTATTMQNDFRLDSKYVYKKIVASLNIPICNMIHLVHLGTPIYASSYSWLLWVAFCIFCVVLHRVFHAYSMLANFVSARALLC